MLSDHRLHRGQPGRQPAGVMLEQNAEEALERAENRPMQHHRRALGAVLIDVMRPEPPRHVQVDLQRAALPVATDRIA